MMALFESSGFLGTKAPFFLDLVGVYFLLLPIVFAVAIYFAAIKRYTWHKQMHVTLAFLTLVMVVIFELGVRLTGGVAYYLESSDTNIVFFTIFLIVHIITALATVIVWSYLLIFSIKHTKDQTFDTIAARHKKLGAILSILLLVTIIQGAAIYMMLFS